MTALPDSVQVLRPEGVPRVVVLVAHGLNQRAAALRQLHEALRARGALIVALTLRGHRRDDEEDAATFAAWRAVEREMWVDDWEGATDVARALAEEHRVPLTFLGFSLGALVHVYALSQRGDAPAPFTRQVLLAPAIRIHPRSRVVRLLRLFGRRFLVPSFTPVAVRSHAVTSVAAYEAVFGLESEVTRVGEPARLRLPTLVLMDPRDELTSAARLTRWIGAHDLAPSWHMRAIEKDRLTAGSRIRHYVTDEMGLGPEPFRALVETIAAALIDGQFPSSSE